MESGGWRACPSGETAASPREFREARRRKSAEAGWYADARMSIPLTILPEQITIAVESGRTILRAGQDGGVDITATCGGRGRCTSCRVKFVAGAIPPPTIMDEIQLGGGLVREGYRLSCQCRVNEPLTVQVAPALDERTFQILGTERPPGSPLPVA